MTVNKNFFNKEILAGQNVFVEAAAIGAVTLVLNYVEYFITLIALGHAGNDLQY